MISQMRRNYRSKRPYRRRKAAAGWTWKNAAAMAKSALKGVSYIKSLINVERKKFYAGADWHTVPLATAATASNLSNIVEGDGYDNRNGISVLAQSLLFRAQITRNSNNTALNNWVRVMLVIDTQFNATDPTLDQIISNTAGSFSIITPLDPYIHGRFRILMDKVYTLTADKPGATIEYYKKFGKKFHINFQGTTGADGSLNRNQILLFSWTSSSSNVPTMVWNSKLTYTDN